MAGPDAGRRVSVASMAGPLLDSHRSVHIWIRNTVDWNDEAAFRAQLPDDLRRQVDLWDHTFTMPYHCFRSRVRQIAAENHARVDGARVTRWEEIPDGELVMPVDDDDWFRPDAARIVSERATPDLAGLRWPTVHLQVPTDRRHRFYLVRRALRLTPQRSVCATNAYAMRKLAEFRHLLDDHMRAGEWFAGEGAARVTRIPERLNLVNRTLASQTQLLVDQRALSRRDLTIKYRRYRRLYHHAWKRRGWARPYVEAMGRLMDELRLR